MAAFGMILMIIVVVVLLIGFIAYYFSSPVAASDVVVTGPISLAEKKTAVSSDAFASGDAATAFLKNGSGTFQTYIYLDSMPKTGQAVACGSRASQPSCSTGLYDPCKCNGIMDCTNCDHEGYRHLFSLFGVYRFEILNVPDASRQNAVSAQLAVRTESATTSGSTTTRDGYIETMPLPPLPLQKWALITLVKDGRQLNVYYDNTLVSSQKMQNVITSINISGAIVETGDSAVSGSAALIRLVDSKYTVNDVSAYYDKTSDTRGNPSVIATDPSIYGAKIGGVQKSSLFHTLCLDGSCLSLPKVRGSVPTLAEVGDSLRLRDTGPFSGVSNLYDVKTSYA